MTLSPTFTPEQLADFCRRAFPECAEPAISGASILPSRQHEMIAFEMTAARAEGGPVRKQLVLRRYVSTLSWWRPDDRGKAQREATICAWLHGLGLPAPDVYLREFGPWGDVVLFSRVAGRELLAQRASLSEVVGAHIDAFARLLARLHRLSPPEEVRRVVPSVSLPGALANLAAMAATIEQPELGRAIERVLELAYDVPEVGPVLVHGDYHLLNARFDGEAISGLLDWEYAALGDPRWDVANAYMQLVDFGAAEAADRFLSTYLAESGWEFEGAPLYNIAVPLQQWTVSEWLVQRQQRGDALGFALAQELIDLRDAHRDRAAMALQWLGG